MMSNNTPLSLTEGPGSPDRPGGNGGMADEAEIRRLVIAFYSAAREDELIGPVFEREVTDWDAHFDRMCEFWSAAVLKTGRYSGRPAMKHFGLGLTPEHFDRWLGLWERTARDELGPGKADPFVDMGNRMARAMLNITGMVG